MEPAPSEVTRLVLALAQIEGVGPVRLKRALPTLRVAQASGDAGISEHARTALNAIRTTVTEQALAQAITAADRILDACAAEQIAAISIADAAYPPQLLALADSPPVLYWQGNLELAQRALAIVGTRAPSASGRRTVQRLAQQFATGNWAICNGLSEGIDLAAIRSDERLVGPVIGVLPSGLSRRAMDGWRRHATDTEAVLKAGGLLVSEQPPHIRAEIHTVVRTGRIQAGLSCGVILIQAALGGGSRYAVRAAAILGRPLGVLAPAPADENHPMSAANQLIVDQGLDGLSSYAEVPLQRLPLQMLVVIRGPDDEATFAAALAASQRRIVAGLASLER